MNTIVTTRAIGMPLDRVDGPLKVTGPGPRLAAGKVLADTTAALTA